MEPDEGRPEKGCGSCQGVPRLHGGGVPLGTAVGGQGASMRNLFWSIHGGGSFYFWHSVQVMFSAAHRLFSISVVIGSPSCKALPITVRALIGSKHFHP